MIKIVFNFSNSLFLHRLKVKMAASKSINLFKQCRKVIGVGRNYLDHALELKNPLPKEPLLFLKPPTCLISEGQPIVIPERSTNVHHEVELGIVIGKGGSNICESEALHHVGGYTLAIDLTARDLQDKIKAKGLPWVMAKCWDTFCPISEIIHPDAITDPQNVGLTLKVDGELRQNGNTKDMIFNIPHLISFCSKIMTLEEGDLILTGTPSGVGPVKSGELIECAIEGITEMKFHVK